MRQIGCPNRFRGDYSEDADDAVRIDVRQEPLANLLQDRIERFVASERGKEGVFRHFGADLDHIGAEELFGAYVVEVCAEVAKDTFFPTLTGDEPLDTVLQKVGERLLAHIYSDRIIRIFRVVAAESVRAPDLAHVFYDAGPAVGYSQLAALLGRAADRGEVAIDDRARAAEQFVSLCRG